jgi:hypothetical protein
MFKGELLRLLFRKFKWKILLLCFLTFLVSCVAFLIRFNLLKNLSQNRGGRGYFFYFLGKYQVHTGDGNYVNWSKLLLISFLLYFPLKIVVHLILNYWKKNYQKEAEIFLTKKLLIYAEKNKHSVTEKIAEKVHIINEIVPKFACQFIDVPVEIFGVLADLFFIIFNLYYLINSYELINLVPLLIIFVLINLAWLSLFSYFFTQKKEDNIIKKNNYQNWEKFQIRIWLENLMFENDNSQDAKNLSNSLDNNYQKITEINLLSTLFQLPNLIISGTMIFFLFFYYNFYCGGEGGLDWSIYFIANDLQRVIQKIEKSFNLASDISSLNKNYQKIKKFFN